MIMEQGALSSLVVSVSSPEKRYMRSTDQHASRWSKMQGVYWPARPHQDLAHIWSCAAAFFLRTGDRCTSQPRRGGADRHETIPRSTPSRIISYFRCRVKIAAVNTKESPWDEHDVLWRPRISSVRRCATVWQRQRRPVSRMPCLFISSQPPCLLAVSPPADLCASRVSTTFGTGLGGVLVPVFLPPLLQRALSWLIPYSLLPKISFLNW